MRLLQVIKDIKTWRANGLLLLDRRLMVEGKKSDQLA